MPKCSLPQARVHVACLLSRPRPASFSREDVLADNRSLVNIVFIAPFAYSPKATVSARMLPMAAALVRAGHAVRILIPPYDNPADGSKSWSAAGVTLENIAASGAGPRDLLAQARRLAARARALNPDIVHVFKPVGVGALAMWLLRRGFGARIVVDNDDWEGRGGWLDVNPYPAAQKALLAWQEGWCLRAARAVTCASETLVERTRQFRGGAAGDVMLFPNGPDNALRGIVAAAEARRDSLRASFGWSHQHVAIYGGTIPLNHDMDVIVKSLGMASHREVPSLALCIVASGPGITSLRTEFENSGLADRVEWHGFMPHDALVERLVAADVALYPYRDTNINRAKCSGKVMDYMAAGKPMVVSDVGMNRVYLEHERSALLTPAGDARAFAAAWQRLAVDPALAHALGRAAQMRIWDVFGWDGRIAALEAVYAQV